MNFTHVADDFTLVNDVGLATRMQKVFAGIWIIINDIMHTCSFKKFLHNTFHCEEIAFAVETERKLNTFISVFCQWQ